MAIEDHADAGRERRGGLGRPRSMHPEARRGEMTSADESSAALTADTRPDAGLRDRTGEAWLDELLELFAEVYPRIDELRDPECASGMCNSITREFTEWLIDQEVDALESQLVGLNHPDKLGYGDRTRDDEHLGHAVALVQGQDAVYAVDWTAAQYGYTALPLVQRLRGYAFERDW